MHKHRRPSFREQILCHGEACWFLVGYFNQMNPSSKFLTAGWSCQTDLQMICRGTRSFTSPSELEWNSFRPDYFHIWPRLEGKTDAGGREKMGWGLSPSNHHWMLAVLQVVGRILA